MTVVEIGILIIVLLLLQGFGLWFLFGRKKDDPKPDDSANLMLMQRLEGLERSLDSRMNESSKQVNDTVRTQLGESAKLIREITQEITSVKEIGRQTQTFAEQLQNLQDILKNPKQRGILGEYYLETLLKNVMGPGDYRIQYPFQNGEIVDAVVVVNKKLVPVDSKFSLDNYNRLIHCDPSERAALEKAFVNDLKLRIVETAKYIRPEENTMDFAFMFIPSEGIYYDLLTNQVGAGEEENLLQRAFSKHKVLIVSPSTFLAYLQTVMQGLKALQIEERAVEIQKRVGELGKHIGAFDIFYKKLGASLGTTVSHFNSGYKELGKLDKDVYRIAGEKIGIETDLLEKPSLELE
jgi:DNA recombination protein RmuC